MRSSLSSRAVVALLALFAMSCPGRGARPSGAGVLAPPPAGPPASSPAVVAVAAVAPSSASTAPPVPAAPTDSAAGPVGTVPPALPELQGLATELDPSTLPDAARLLGAVAWEVPVHHEPTWNSRKLGYLRAGGVVQRDAEPVSRASCPGGWYAIRPEGYVCAGRAATVDAAHPILHLLSRRANRAALLPYVYGRSSYPPPPLYLRLPTEKEQRQAEVGWKPPARPTSDYWARLPARLPAEDLAEGANLPLLWGDPAIRGALLRQKALPNSAFAFVDFVQNRGRLFGLTTDLALVPLDRVAFVDPSRFHGIALPVDMPLPAGFYKGRGAVLYDADPAGGPALHVRRVLEPREALLFTGVSRQARGGRYLEVRGGGWVAAGDWVMIEAKEKAPRWARPGRTWLDVSILNQTLVAYEGDRPVYATLVSTGADGLGDPVTTHSTVRGQFLIHTKHVSVAMGGNTEGDEFDLRDVPYVQYFEEGYALHAAYWHDAFGRPRSHGCVNLAPADARWLFRWSDPPVPEGWHGAYSATEGTLISIHP